MAHESADVWANPENFCLDERNGKPAIMAGTSPDYFSNLYKDGSPRRIKLKQTSRKSIDVISISLRLAQF